MNIRTVGQGWVIWALVQDHAGNFRYSSNRAAGSTTREGG